MESGSIGEGRKAEMDFKDRVLRLKNLLKELHEGKSVGELKARFKELLSEVSPLEIPVIEQELVREGISPFEIARMCDLHVELFREAVARRGGLKDLPPGHPLHTLLRENDAILRDAEILSLYAKALSGVDDPARKDILGQLRKLASELLGVRRHFAREQMLVFPYLERRGITAVATVLWTKQDEIRFKIKSLLKLVSSEPEDWGEFAEKLGEKALQVSRALTDMVFRENNILYPTLNVLLSEGEWAAIREQEDVIGYYKVEPGDSWRPSAKPLLPFEVDPRIDPDRVRKLPAEMQKILSLRRTGVDTYGVVREGDLRLDFGYLSPKELDALLKTLPFDITFVDENDRVRYFARREDLIFPRTPSVVGRPVQLCHPPRSVHIVNRIIKEFKEGRRDRAEFWIRVGGRFIYILYFPVRDGDGRYLGTVEISQDATRIRELEGEKRILDWR